MYHKFSLLLFCLTIYSQFSIVVYGEDELRHKTKKKKGGQKQEPQQEKPPTVCIVPIPLQTYQPSYVHSGDQFQHSYIGSNQELRKKGKPTITDNKSGCVVVTSQTPNSQESEQQLKKKKEKKKRPNKFRPFKKKKKKKQQAQMIAQLEADLGIAFKDLMASLDYFWPKLQITFTTGTASIGHNIFSGIIPLMAAGLKLKKILFFMMDPMFSSMMYSLGYSHSRPRPKTSVEQASETANEEEESQNQDVQEDEQTYTDSSSSVVTEQQFYDQKEDEEEEEEEEDGESESQDDEDNEDQEDEDDEDQPEEQDDNDSEEQDDEEGEEYDEENEESDQTNDEGNVDYPAKDSAEIDLKRPETKDSQDYLVGLSNIWDGMVTGFDDLSMTGEF